MKLKSMIGSVLALTLGLGSVAHAAGSYFPPERIHCSVSQDGNTVNCDGFNRSYLIEDTHTANFPTGNDLTLFFVSAVAYYTPGENETTVFFTYNDSHSKMVKLKTTNTAIHPDLANGAWKKFKDEFYTCNAGYMSCPITNLPSFAS